MNCFCFPGVSPSVLGSDAPSSASQTLGFLAGPQLTDGTSDKTEIDMRVGGFIVEAKHTESDGGPRACGCLSRFGRRLAATR